ncbi:MAG: tRNA pseudouridine(55) synthase TruB [Treponemataceae bacterium]|nr:MAG: tRNA pseudouridine(55) synthase TruB [Treponemataceae bacterium]
MTNCVALIDKRAGITSFEALGEIKRALGTKKVGHTGTLDCFASGLLIALAGGITRLAPYITALPKTYRASILFGAETDTLDPLGSIERTAPLPNERDFRAALGLFTGVIQQMPPRYSALKIGGKRASDLARAGRDVTMNPRPVTIYSIQVTEIQKQMPANTDSEGENHLVESAEILVSCSAGTYIRSLARDIAQSCGSAGYLDSLRRLCVGGFSVEQAGNSACPALLPMTPALASRCGLIPLTLDAARKKDFFNGAQIRGEWFAEFSREGTLNGAAHTPCAVFAADGGEFAGAIIFDAREKKFSYGFSAR